AKLVDVGGNFRVVDRFERRDDLVSQPRHLVGWKTRIGARALDRFDGRRVTLPLAGIVRVHAKKSCAFIRACARLSTSARVLYRANDARQVAVVPNRASNGMVQWVP